jgi:hypothetical protein
VAGGTVAWREYCGGGEVWPVSNIPFVILDKKNTWLDGTIGKVIFFSN